ncbi:hypothetical protein [Corynebacterium efficiens YS-314]|uniref:Uncharacterized protein n=1 Tax=Corynebacterium efficiens (strain DSM 44549 / YS-314 / AJ 12310 / JCM 11189 / NBRC 100395) TaxID=196164 RepID=Q8FM14_COREF|nr:hypothetical protein [Corynebacterium efficiens YS-314]
MSTSPSPPPSGPVDLPPQPPHRPTAGARTRTGCIQLQGMGHGVPPPGHHPSAALHQVENQRHHAQGEGIGPEDAHPQHPSGPRRQIRGRQDRFRGQYVPVAGGPLPHAATVTSQTHLPHLQVAFPVPPAFHFLHGLRPPGIGDGRQVPPGWLVRHPTDGVHQIPPRRHRLRAYPLGQGRQGDQSPHAAPGVLEGRGVDKQETPPTRHRDHHVRIRRGHHLHLRGQDGADLRHPVRIRADHHHPGCTQVRRERRIRSQPRQFREPHRQGTEFTGQEPFPDAQQLRNPDRVILRLFLIFYVYEFLGPGAHAGTHPAGHLTGMDQQDHIGSGAHRGPVGVHHPRPGHRHPDRCIHRAHPDAGRPGQFIQHLTHGHSGHITEGTPLGPCRGRPEVLRHIHHGLSPNDSGHTPDPPPSHRTFPTCATAAGRMPGGCRHRIR